MALWEKADYEAAVADVIGAAVDPLSWPADVLDAGLRAALAEYEAAAPTVRKEWQVVTGGVKQDLSSLTDMKRVAAIAWPWMANGGEVFEWPGLWVRFVTFDGAVVRFLDVAPATGDWLLVRYWRLYTIKGLDMGTAPVPAATNVPANDQYLLSLGAGGHACSVRLRQLSEEAGVPERAVSELTAVRDGLLAGFAAGLARLGVGGVQGGVSWASFGL